MKNRMFRAMMATLLLTAMLLSVVACGGTQAGDPLDTGDTTTTTQGETVEQTKEDETQTTTKPVGSYEVTEQDGKADVKTPSGLQYTLSGYDSINKATPTFTQGLTVTFPEGTPAENFNRFTMTYKASAPVMVYVSYKKGTLTLEHDYFVEAGEGTFSGLVQHFLDGNHGEALVSMKIDTCQGKAATFTLSDMTTELMEVPDKTTVYIANEVYKLGVDLNWGGTINFIRDMTNPIGGLTNLVNKFDTGRLIQQSFYGTPAIPGVYEPGEFNNSKWVYNPVQGGDKYQNPSRLIDLVIGETSIYIKSQPQDWSLDNQLTHSYMENTYTLEKDHIRVDNRFIDFSGWEHPQTSQELPALYTVSFLDTFVWYSDNESWTDDDLSYHGDLNFWGDPAYASDCLFRLKEKNLETWCAWINSEKDYGLGLYVPNIDRFTAGRYEYGSKDGGTKDPTANPCSYVAPLKILKLVSYEALEYSYIMTTGSIKDIRDTFKAYKDFATNEDLSKNATNARLPAMSGDVTNIDFTDRDNLPMLAYPYDTVVEFDEAEGAAKLTAGASNDVNISIPYSSSSTPLNAGDYTTLRIEYMIPKTNANPTYRCDIFLCAGENKEPTGSAHFYTPNLIKDGEYHVIEINLSKHTFWKDQIYMIRIDYFDASTEGDVMYIKNVSLS